MNPRHNPDTWVLLVASYVDLETLEVESCGSLSSMIPLLAIALANWEGEEPMSKETNQICGPYKCLM